MREIFNDDYYRITIDGEIDELDNEDLMKIYMEASNPNTMKKIWQKLCYMIN